MTAQTIPKREIRREELKEEKKKSLKLGNLSLQQRLCLRFLANTTQPQKYYLD